MSSEAAEGSLLDHPYLRHLRLGFNLLLSPIYLWGVLLAGGTMGTAEFWLGYVSLHLFLFGGTTAFNSYYDRDEGPVGGMLRPPPVDDGLLRFSLVVQALGLVPAAFVGWRFLLAWLTLFVGFTAYSHPLVRLKAHPVASLLAIALGQGGLGFALGWLAARAGSPTGPMTVDPLTGGPAAPVVGPFGPEALWGAASAALIVTGLYLVTQCYQEDEDRERGDRTVAVIVGGRTSLLLALVPLTLGGAMLVTWTWITLSVGWAAGLGAFFLALGVYLLAWARRFPVRSVTENYRSAMRFTVAASGGFTLFLLVQLARV